VAFIKAHRDRDTEGLAWGVEPICRVLQFAPSTYYAAISRRPSARERADQLLGAEVLRVFWDNFGVYGAEKIWRQLQREGFAVGRDRVARLMHRLGISGLRRGRPRRTTIPGPDHDRPADLVKRDFNPPAPNRLWVADLTYVATASGFDYVAFLIDAFARVIVGWAVSSSPSAGLVLDALEMAIWSRKDDDLTGLVHHSDRGVQYTAIRYTERLEAAGAAPSVGSQGDSFDNSLAEAVNGLYKAECVWRQGPWRTTAALEAATAAWVGWWNTGRLHSACGWVPPGEVEATWRTRTQTA
jgi:putative transposase